MLVARASVARPDATTRTAELLRRKGDEHERAPSRDAARAPSRRGRRVRSPGSGIESYRAGRARTLEAMRQGVPIIYQATFFDGRFIGHADFLRRVDGPSNSGRLPLRGRRHEARAVARSRTTWFSSATTASTWNACKDAHAEFGYVVFGDGEEERFRLNDYMAYYRHLKTRSWTFAERGVRANRPSPTNIRSKCGHCAICPWNDDCRERSGETTTILSLVALDAARSNRQIRSGGYRARHRARGRGRRPASRRNERRDLCEAAATSSLQVRGRSSVEPIYELLAHRTPLGFALLADAGGGRRLLRYGGRPALRAGPQRSSISSAAGCPTKVRRFARSGARPRRREARVRSLRRLRRRIGGAVIPRCTSTTTPATRSRRCAGWRK